MRFSMAKTLLATMSILFFVALAQIVLESYADARAGGGTSGGFRGSRSYSSPARPTQPSNPAQPRRETTPSQQPSPMAPQSGGFMRTFGTAMLGGLLGSMLFSGLANAGFGGFGGSGIGMIEILLFAGIGYFIYRKFRSPALATGYGSMQYQNSQPYTQYTSSNPPAQETPSSNEIDYRSLTLMDRSFNPDQFLKTAQDSFFKVRARGQQNRMENIALRESEITEVWTENGEDYITTRLRANLLDYTVDAKSGAVVSGSNSEPIEFEEYWTFARPVGPNAWKLTAVQQA